MLRCFFAGLATKRCQVVKFLIQTFFKKFGAVKGSALVALRRARNPFRPFFFCQAFFLWAFASKKKSGQTQTESFTGKRKVTLSVAAYRQAPPL
jgi:hypothetical protein